MLSYFDLRKGVKFILDGEPYEVLQFTQMKKAQREGIAQTKIKNLITGRVFERNFHQGETFETAEIAKIEVKFLYSHTRVAAKSGKEDLSSLTRGKFYFCEPKKPAERFELSEDQIGWGAKFLKPNQIVFGLKFKEKIINISLPIKVQLKVVEAPPGVKGERAQAGTKQVILETGTPINVPLFVKQGDIIEVNTENGEYTRRIE